MRRPKTKCLIRMGIVALVLLWVGVPTLGLSKPLEGESQLAPIKPSLMQTSRLQIPFIANEGQISDQRVGYYAKTFGATLYVTQNGEMTYALSLRKPGEDKLSGWVLKEIVEDAAKITPAGVEQAQTKVSYFKGNDPSKWKTNIATCNELDLGEVYPGIDLKLRAYGNNVEKIFTINPGANPDTICIKIDGALSLEIDATGELAAHTALGPVRFSKPIAYQDIKGKKAVIRAAYEVQKKSYGFRVGNYDHRLPLIIDPTLVASTFLGGSSSDEGRAVTLDSSDNVYVTGRTYATDFPTTTGAYDTQGSGSTDSDVFVSKFDSGLSTLSASTFIGGDAIDIAYSIVLDSSNYVHVTGHTRYTAGTAYPTTTGAYDTALNGGSGDRDVFVSELNPDLSSLTYSTYLGGSSSEEGRGIVTDSGNSNVFVTGYTASSGFPVTSGVYDTILNSTDVFISKLSLGTSGNSTPSTPTAVSPSDKAQVSGGPVSLESSTFSDPESDSHISTAWRVRDAGAPFGKSDYDSSFDIVCAVSGRPGCHKRPGNRAGDL